MPSISERFNPASATAISAALLMRSSEDEPSCLPYDVSPTPVMKLMTVVTFVPLYVRHSGMVRRTRPGISRFRVRIFDAPRNDVMERLPSQLQYDFGRPSTFSAIKLRMSCGLIGA